MEDVEKAFDARSPSLAASDTRLHDADKADQSRSDKALSAFPPGDPEDPLNWPTWRKHTYTFILGFATLALVFNSSGYAASYPEVEQAYNVGYEVSILGLSLYVLAFGVGPVIWAPISEVIGRRPVYIISYAMFTAFSFGVAWAPNIGGLLVMRFLAAAAGSATLSNAAASGGDYCHPAERMKFGAIYGTTLFLGPALGPLICTFITIRANWHWNLRVEAILAAVAALLLVTIPETYAPVLLRRRAERNGIADLPPRPSLIARLRVTATLPFKMLFTEPIVMAISAYMSLLYGLLYGFFTGLPYAFIEVRGWSRESLALAYIPIAAGSLTGGLLLYGPGTRMVAKLAQKRAAQGGSIEPEDRLRAVRLVAPFSSIGLFIFAFTSYPNVHWFGQMVGLYLFSVSLIMSFTGLIPYIIDAYKVYAASALAATAFARAAFATSFPLFIAQQFRAMSVPGAVGLYAGIAALLIPIPFIFIRYGPQLRSRSRYAF